MSFWRQLATERELRGVTLKEVSRVTKIPLSTLEAIESGDRERLPDAAYLVGYLRAYAEVVGLDPDDVVLRYQEARMAEQETVRFDSDVLQRHVRRRRFASVGAVVLVVAVAVAFLLMR